MKSKQIEFWTGDFGKEYTERNPQSLEEWDKLYLDSFGIKKTEMNDEFLKELDKDIKILEVGCNIGLQLMGLQRQGFTNLYGIELQEYAVKKAHKMAPRINIIQGSGFDIPFKDDFFDLVYTSGVLIHIAPTDLSKIMSEMLRCTKRYIWGYEYYASEPKEINYRGNKGFLWKMDYAKKFKELDSRITEVKRKKYTYLTEKEKGNEDLMYLLELTN